MPRAALGRFFAICNCCNCCCGAMQARRNGVPMLASSGFVGVVDRGKCEVCGTCVEKCPLHAIRLEDSRFEAIRKNAGMRCVLRAPPARCAVAETDFSRSHPLEIGQLLAEIS